MEPKNHKVKSEETEAERLARLAQQKKGEELEHWAKATAGQLSIEGRYVQMENRQQRAAALEGRCYIKPGSRQSR